MRLPRFILEQPQLAAFALLATMASGFGQTFFISLFGAHLREALELSNTGYGTLYASATIVSAALLLRTGTLVDRLPLHRVSTITIRILVAGCILMALSFHAAILWLAFMLLRLGGQGMMGHLAMTVAARYFTAHRGKAVALAALGYPLSETVFPVAAVMLIAAGGWRTPWLVGAGLLITLFLPLMSQLSRNTPLAEQLISTAQTDHSATQFTRGQALRDPGLYLLLPAAVAGPFIFTGIFFHLTTLAELRGWSLLLIAGAFTAYALSHLLGIFIGGPLVDRLGAQRFLPVSLLPMFSGLLLLAGFKTAWVLSAFMGLAGLTAGLVSTASSAMWAERYGIRHLGAIRAMAQGSVVLSTSISPVLIGLLLDMGISVTLLGLLLAGLTGLAFCMAFLAKR